MRNAKKNGMTKRAVSDQRAMRVMKAAAAAMLLSVWLAGCSSSQSKDAGAAKAGSAAMTSAKNDAAAVGTNSSSAAQSGAAKEALPAVSPGAGFTGKDGTPAAADPFSRKIIYSGRLTMQVDNYAQKQAEVQEAVKLAGGYVLQFNESVSASEKSGNLSIKVPAWGFQSFIDRLEKISPALQKNLQGQDVTEEFVDLAARLKAKQVAESRLLSFMEKASKTDELVAFSNELGKVQEEIERIKGRMRYLEQNVAYSTIELRIFQKLGSAEVINGQDRGPLLQRAASALNGTYAVLSLVFQWIVIILAGALPVLILALVIGLPVWFLRRGRKERLSDIRKRLEAENKKTMETPLPEEMSREPEAPNKQE